MRLCGFRRCPVGGLGSLQQHVQAYEQRERQHAFGLRCSRGRLCELTLGSGDEDLEKRYLWTSESPWDRHRTAARLWLLWLSELPALPNYLCTESGRQPSQELCGRDRTCAFVVSPENPQLDLAHPPTPTYTDLQYVISTPYLPSSSSSSWSSHDRRALILPGPTNPPSKG